MFSKVPNIFPLLGLIYCLLYQQSSVGSTTYDLFDAKAEIVGLDYSQLMTVSDSDSTAIRQDTLSAKMDTSEKADEVLKSKIKYHSRDSMRVDVENEVVYLYGDAVVDYEDLHLKADYIMVDMNKKELFAKGSTDSLGQLIGKPEFSQAQQQFRAHSLRYNFDTKKGKITYVITKEGEGYIHGDEVKKDAFNNFYVRNGAYTTCDLDTPHFAIMSHKLKVISNNKIVTGPSFLTIEEVPTPLFIPFGFFPNRKGRSSGILFPAFGEDSRGFFFQHLGYYFGFSDYFNTSVTGDLYTLGSYTLELSSEYAKRYHHHGNFRLSYARVVNSEKELPDFSEQREFHINWSHNQDPKARPNSTFNASVNAGSSNFYRNTISSQSNFLQNTFSSSIAWQKTFPDKPFNLGLSMTHSQNILTHDIRVNLPDVSFGISRISIPKSKYRIGPEKWYEKIGASLSTRATNYVQTKDSLLFRQESLNDLKNGVQHSIPVTTSIKLLKYFALSPSVNYTERWYLQTVSYNWNPLANKIDTTTVKNFSAIHDYQTSAQISTRIYGMFQSKKGPIAAIRHVMNPSAAFTYRPDYSESQYGYYKQVQYDSVGDSRLYSIYQGSVYGYPDSGKFSNLSFALDNNLEMKVRTNSDSGATLKKIKLFESLRIGGNYNLAADSMKLSVFSLTGRTTLFDKIGINFSSTLDPYAYDSNNNDYDQYQYEINNQFARLTHANLSLNFSLAGKSQQNSPQKFSRDELDNIKQHPEDYVDFNIPYNLTVGYSYDYSKRGALAATKNQSINVNTDINLTPKWKVTFNSWYDFSTKQVTNFSMNIYRDLHCWEMHLTWVPFGLQQSYLFQINVKSAILQDLKLIKKPPSTRAL